MDTKNISPLEKIFKNSNDLYLSIIENSNDLIWVLDTNGRFIYINPACEKFSGYKIDQWLNKGLESLITESDLPLALNALKKTLTGERQEIRLSVINIDKTILRLHVSATPIITNNEVQAIVCFGRDITAHERAEKKLLKNHFDLEREIFDRVSEIRQKNIELELKINSRKISENKMKMQESILEKIPNPVLATDMSGIINYWNNACEELYGWSENEVIGKNFLDLIIPPESLSTITESIEALNKTGKWEGEIKARTKGNKLIDVFVSYSVIKNENGLDKGIICIDVDLTSQKELIKKYSESESLFKTIFKNAPLGMALVNKNGDLKQVNKALIKMFGYDEKELIGKNFKDITHPEDLKLNNIMRGKLLAGEISKFSIQKRYIHKKGHIVWVTLSAAKYYNVGLKENIYIVLAQDITKQKQTEQSLLSSENKYKTILNSANDPIFISDSKTGKIVEANEKAAELTGYSRKRLVGMNQADLHPRKDTKKHKELFNKRLASVVNTPKELEIVHRNGEIIPVEISSSIIDVNDNLFLHGLFRDIRQKKKMETLNNSLIKIHKSINSSLNFDKIMQSVVKESIVALECDAGAIILNDNAKLKVKYQRGLSSKSLKINDDFSKSCCNVKTLLSEDVAINNNTTVHNHYCCDHMKSHKIKSSISASLTFKDESIGIIEFYHFKKKTTFNAKHKYFIRNLASSLSLAMENARLYEKQQNIADVLQKSLLNKPRDIKGIDFECIYRPATNSAKVGGDFFDIFKIDKTRVAIIVGDVSGKGVEAAALTSFTKSIIKAYAFQFNKPSLIISEANKLIFNEHKKGSFITVFFAILNIETKELTYCNCGHPPAIIRRNNKNIYLKTTSPALGIIEKYDFQQKTSTFKDDDFLIALTDGVIEARCSIKKSKKKGFFGEQRLSKALNKLSPDLMQAPNDILASILDCGCELSDDIVILSLGYSKPLMHS